jgi:hypothetical protein
VRRGAWRAMTRSAGGPPAGRVGPAEAGAGVGAGAGAGEAPGGDAVGVSVIGGVYPAGVAMGRAGPPHAGTSAGAGGASG